MEKSNLNYESIENLTNSERTIRVLISTAAIVVAMESSIAGTALFAVLCVLGIALAMTGIIGWDPVRAMSRKHATHKVHTTGHHGHTA